MTVDYVTINLSCYASAWSAMFNISICFCSAPSIFVKVLISVLLCAATCCAVICMCKQQVRRDAAAGELDDSMESFFLSETTKYLFLLQANTTDLPDHYVFTTEGHLLPPFAPLQPSQAPGNINVQRSFKQYSSWCQFLPDFSRLWLGHSDCPSLSHVTQPTLPSMLPEADEARFASNASNQCASLCVTHSAAELHRRQQHLQAALPLLPLTAADSIMLRYRCCFCLNACTKALYSPALLKTPASWHCACLIASWWGKALTGHLHAGVPVAAFHLGLKNDAKQLGLAHMHMLDVAATNQLYSKPFVT